MDVKQHTHSFTLRADTSQSKEKASYLPEIWSKRRLIVLKEGRKEGRKSKAPVLCESRGCRPGLLSLIRLMVSVDVKHHERKEESKETGF